MTTLLVSLHNAHIMVTNHHPSENSVTFNPDANTLPKKSYLPNFATAHSLRLEVLTPDDRLTSEPKLKYIRIITIDFQVKPYQWPFNSGDSVQDQIKTFMHAILGTKMNIQIWIFNY